MGREADWEQMALVGRIVRPIGNRGEVVIASETDFPETRFAPGAELLTRRGQTVELLRVRAMRMHQGRPVVAFDGAGSIDDAEALRGLELRIPDAALTPLGPGQHYVHDLIGCRVVTVDGRQVGEVVRVDLDAGAPLLAVRRTGEWGGEALVPLVEAICRRIDTAGREIVIAPPSGLLDVNG